MSIRSKHYEELRASGISDALIERYFYSTEGQVAQEWLIEDELGKLGGHSQQYATRPVQWMLKQSEHVKKGGWVCRANGQIKPDTPRQAVKKRSDGQWVPAFNDDGAPKLIKYESIREKPYRGAHVGLMQPLSVACDTIIITEGGKKAGCAATLGYRAIPLPGVDMAAETGTNTLIAVISELPHDADIVIAFDSDSKKSTIEGVARSTARLGSLLKNAGFISIRVARWEPSAGKGLDDIYAANGADFVHSVVDKAQKFAQWQASRMSQSLRSGKPGYYGLTDKNRRVINQRYIDLHLPTPGSILAVSSPMETGKTVAGGKLKDEFFRRHPDGLLELQGYRNGLGQQTAGKWSMDHISDLETSGANVSQMLIDEADALAYCLDSLNRRARAISEAISENRKVLVFLDEADAVLKHILGGGTLGKRQAEIWETWCAALSAVISGGGYIVLAEAHLSQIAVDAVAEISGGKVEAIENQYQPHTGRKVFDYDALNKQGKHADQLLAKACLTHTRKLAESGPVFLASDAQGFAEKSEAVLLADGFSVLRIDGDTTDRPETREFLQSPDSYIAAHTPDVVIATTTAESGVSISGGYFENVVLYGSHLEDRALGQLSGRVRGDAPLHLFAKRRVNSFGDDPDSFSVQGILKEWEQNAFDSGSAADISQYFDAELLKAAGESLKDMNNQRFHRLKATYQARMNISRFSLHYGLVSILKEMGCEVTSASLQPSAFEQSDKDAFDKGGEIVVERSTSRFVAEELDKSVSWAIQVESSASSTRSDRTKAKKILLDSTYPGLPLNDHEFVKDEVIKGRCQNLHAHAFSWLCQNPKIAQIIDLQSWKTQLEQQFVILPALRKESARVKVLAQSALVEVAKLESYSEASPLVVAVAQWAKERAKMLGRLFRLQIKGTQTNIAIVNKLLRKIGYRSKVVRKTGERGNQIRNWKAEAKPYQAEVWAALSQKWAGELGTESIDIEQPQSRSHNLHIDSLSIKADRDYQSKTPVSNGGGPPELSESDQLALANLMIRYGSYEKMTAQINRSDISEISVVAINRFAALSAL